MKRGIGDRESGVSTPEGTVHANDIQINMRYPGPGISGSNSTNNSQLTLARTNGRTICCLLPSHGNLYAEPRARTQAQPQSKLNSK